MAQPYLGEIRTAGFNFAPVGYLPCDGRLLPISQYDALYNLLGTTYGGDGVQTFGLPDLRGRIPLHTGSGFPLGQVAGSETVTLLPTQIPTHIHQANGGGGAAASTPAANLPGATTAGQELYAPTGGDLVPFAASAVAPAGGGQPHDNMMPFQVINFIIAVEGVYPSQN